MNHPAIVEERSSECDLMRERFNRLLDYRWLVVKHGLEMRSNDLQHQHVVFSVYPLYLEMIQESEDMVRSRMSS